MVGSHCAALLLLLCIKQSQAVSPHARITARLVLFLRATVAGVPSVKLSIHTNIPQRLSWQLCRVYEMTYCQCSPFCGWVSIKCAFQLIFNVQFELYRVSLPREHQRGETSTAGNQKALDFKASETLYTRGARHQSERNFPQSFIQIRGSDWTKLGVFILLLFFLTIGLFFLKHHCRYHMDSLIVSDLLIHHK